MESNYIKGQEKKIQKGFRDEIAFEVNPKEWLEFCLGEWARGAFWAEGTQTQRFRAEGQTQKCKVQSVVWGDSPTGCLPAGNWLKMKPDTGRCRIGRNNDCYSRVWTWSCEPLVSKPGYADSWVLSTTSLSQSGVESKSLCFHQGLQTMHSHGWDPLQWTLPGLSVKERHYHHWTVGRLRSKVNEAPMEQNARRTSLSVLA